jgi:hypothetical protein
VKVYGAFVYFPTEGEDHAIGQINDIHENFSAIYWENKKLSANDISEEFFDAYLPKKSPCFHRVKAVVFFPQCVDINANKTKIQDDINSIILDKFNQVGIESGVNANNGRQGYKKPTDWLRESSKKYDSEYRGHGVLRDDPSDRQKQILDAVSVSVGDDHLLKKGDKIFLSYGNTIKFMESGVKAKFERDQCGSKKPTEIAWKDIPDINFTYINKVDCAHGLARRLTDLKLLKKDQNKFKSFQKTVHMACRCNIET